MMLLWVAVCVAIVLAGCGVILFMEVRLLRRVSAAINRLAVTPPGPQSPVVKSREPLTASASHE